MTQLTETQPVPAATTLLSAARRAIASVLIFISDAIVQLAVEDVCMAVVATSVTTLLSLHFAA
jgi:hypothetical protein